MASDPHMIAIDYTNYKGERSMRVVIPIDFWYGTSEFHKGEQWFMCASDVMRQSVHRHFAMKDIHGWHAPPPLCEQCGKNPSDPPSKFCPGCDAYLEHQA